MNLPPYNAAFENGRDDYDDDIPRDHCPYDRSEPDKRDQWLSGWDAGRRQDRRRNTDRPTHD